MAHRVIRRVAIFLDAIGGIADISGLSSKITWSRMTHNRPCELLPHGLPPWQGKISQRTKFVYPVVCGVLLGPWYLTRLSVICRN